MTGSEIQVCKYKDYYKGCANCKHQIDVFRTCEWLENGGDGQLHLQCPRWERKTIKDNKEMI